MTGVRPDVVALLLALDTAGHPSGWTRRDGAPLHPDERRLAADATTSELHAALNLDQLTPPAAAGPQETACARASMHTLLLAVHERDADTINRLWSGLDDQCRLNLAIATASAVLHCLRPRFADPNTLGEHLRALDDDTRTPL